MPPSRPQKPSLSLLSAGRTFRLLLLPLLLALLSSACTAPSPATRTVTLSVPFLPQPPDQCGPAALAMLETFYGRTPDLPALTDYLLIPALAGTTPDLLAEAARRDGFSVQNAPLTPRQIHAVLAAGDPLILLLGPNPKTPDDPRGHFLVATGHNPRTHALRAHTGLRNNVWLPSAEWLPRYRTALRLSPVPW